MRILVIGGNGTIGRRVVESLQLNHEIVIAGRSNGDILVDISDRSSIENMFNEVGEIDSLVCIAGEAKWASFDTLTEDDFYIGIKSKMMGQINLVRIGKKFIKEGGSITLSTGILADDPVLNTTSAAMVNGAILSFVKAVSLN